MTNLDHQATTAAADPGYGIAPAGYRLPADTRLGAVTLQVADLERSLAYYRDVLGFRVAEQSAGRAALAAHGEGAPLVVLHEKLGVAPVPRRGRLGLYHFAILLPNRAALGRFVAHLASIGERAGASDHLVSEALYLQDPDGLGIEVYADRPRATWRSESRQLADGHGAAGPGEPGARGRRRAVGGDARGHRHRPRSPARGRHRRGGGVLPPGAGAGQGGVELPGRAVPVRGRLPSPPGREHLGRRRRPGQRRRRAPAGVADPRPVRRGRGAPRWTASPRRATPWTARRTAASRAIPGARPCACARGEDGRFHSEGAGGDWGRMRSAER